MQNSKDQNKGRSRELRYNLRDSPKPFKPVIKEYVPAKEATEILDVTKGPQFTLIDAVDRKNMKRALDHKNKGKKTQEEASLFYGIDSDIMSLGESGL